MDKKIDLLIQIPDHPPLLQLSPPSLSDLLSKLSSITSRPVSSHSILYNRGGTFFLISDNETYLSTITKALNKNLDSLEIKIEFLNSDTDLNLFSSIPQTTSEEVKVEANIIPEAVHNAPEPFGLHYRYLNGQESQRFRGLEIENFDLTMRQLSDVIVKKEGFVESEWVCAFYAEDGSPITGTLSQMRLVKAERLIRPGARVCVYIVPDFDIKSGEALIPSGIDRITVVNKENVEQAYSFEVDLETATVMYLKQVLYHFTSIPTYELTLKLPDSFLSRNTALLSEYNVTSDSQLSFEKSAVQYSPFSYKHHNKQSIPQSPAGLLKLHTFLHTLSKHSEISEKPIRESLLGYVRNFTSNDPAYTAALYHLTKGKNISVLTSIALEEGSILLAKTVMQEVFKEQVESFKVLEYIIEVFTLLCDLSCSPQEELSHGEVFKEYNVDCPLTLKPVQDPVLIRRTDAKSLYYEHSEVLRKIKADEEIKYVGKIKENELRIDEGFRLVARRAQLNEYAEVFVWEGVFDTTKSVGQLVAEKYPDGATLEKIKAVSKDFKITMTVPPLSLKKTEFKDCMSLDKNGALVIFYSLYEKEPNKVQLMNALTRTIVVTDIDDLASAIEMRNPAEVGKEVITRNPDEAIVVVFDVSGSMSTKFFGDRDFSRLDATKEFFETFTDRNAGFDFSHVISLLLFSNKLKRACGFTENIVTFSSHVQHAAPGGGTKLWDALGAATEYLTAFKASYPNVHLRILCLSDGEDSSSALDYTTIAKGLVAGNITMDSIVVGALSQELKAVSFATGGYVFMPKTMQEGIKLFESESFLSVRARQVPSRVLVNTEADLAGLLGKDTSDCKPSPSPLPKQTTAAVTNISAALKSAEAASSKVSAGKSAGSLTRITKELAVLESNPHPNFSVFPTADDIYFWNVYITGPETTPYEGGTFQLLVQIPDQYPFKPPKVRFVTPIYHCNISKSGSICLSLLQDQWSPALTISKVFESIFGLLLTPEPLDPLDAYIATEYRMNFDQFCKNAAEYTAQHASKSLKDILTEQNNRIPAQFLCGITGKIMIDPVTVVKSSNVYERSEILTVIHGSGKEPKTGEAITEADLVPNAALKASIEEFHKLKASNP